MINIMEFETANKVDGFVINAVSYFSYDKENKKLFLSMKNGKEIVVADCSINLYLRFRAHFNSI